MILRNDNDLIGDFIGTIPAMRALAQTTELEVIVKDSVSELFEMTRLKRSNACQHDISFDLHAAFALADRQNLHMIQANYAYVGLEIPQSIPRPQLNVRSTNVPAFDYILAPFSRSLPPEQRWQKEKWQALVDSMPSHKFCIVGNSIFDDRHFLTGTNVSSAYDCSMTLLCNLLQKSKHGLISVVTGISHLAYALNIPNYLFVNQGTWGKNPEAIYFDKHIPDISIEEVSGRLPK